MATETQRPAAVLAPVAAPRPGMRLGRYELLSQLATGGMAVVWLARQLGQFGFRRNVALKTIRPEFAADVAFRRMFLDEARLASLVHHANVVEVLDLGEEGDVVYQAIELVEGPTLKRLIEVWRGTHDGGLPASIASRVAVDTLRGLHAAHELRDEHGARLCLVHRDVSPHNILVGNDGLAKIADFGIAKAFGRITDETEAGSVKGKYGYMSPEQLRRAPLDRRSDVFAAGIVLWEALTGRRLFGGRDVLETAERVLTLPIDDLHELVPSIPQSLASVVAQALARAPEQRHASAEAMADAIEAAVRIASGRELAEFVGDHATAEVRALRDALEETAVLPDPPTLTAATPPGVATDLPVRSRRHWPLVLIPLLLIAAIALLSQVRSRRASGEVARTEPTPSAGPSAVESLPSTLPASAERPSTDRDASVSSGAQRPAQARPTQRPRAVSSARSQSSADRDPKFGNPYER